MSQALEEIGGGDDETMLDAHVFNDLDQNDVMKGVCEVCCDLQRL